MAGATHGFVSFPISSWWSILTLPTITAVGVNLPTAGEKAARNDRIAAFLAELIGVPINLIDETDKVELGALAGTDIVLHNALARIAQGSRGAAPVSAARRYLLRDKVPVSRSLRVKLETVREAAQKKWNEEHPELSGISAGPS